MEKRHILWYSGRDLSSSMKDQGFLTRPERHLKKKFFWFFLAGFFAVAIIGYVATTAWYVVQIKQGKQIILGDSGRFTATGAANNENYFDREFLEGGSHPYRGKKEGAEVVIVEFVDYNCPNCRSVYDDIDKLAGIYGNRAKVIFRQFPATSISGHEDSSLLSEIVLCGWKQNRFPVINDYIFKNYETLPHPIEKEQIETVFADSGLDMKKLAECLSDPRTAEEVNKDYFDGVSAGVRGTPTFFVNGQKVEGAVPFEMWKKYFDALNP